MKFTCDSCAAQYMISDDKVGPSGVKVRCKKCGNVILVRRAAAEGEPRPSATNGASTAPSLAAPAAASPAGDALSDTAPSPATGAQAGNGPAPAGAGLDAELGQAFDHAFGDTPPESPAPGAGGDMAATQLMGSEDAAKVFADKGAAPAASDWYVAIGQAQVGPLPVAEVKKKWEAGDVGPDSLVWRPGMADWAPLTTVADLAGVLAPVPRPQPRLQRSAEPRPAEGARAEARPAATPAPEPGWKPVGASALAALANEEIAARSAPEPKPAPRTAQGGAKSLVDALPDGGGVDPTGALPLNIKALEASTGEKKIERKTSVARGAAEARHRSATRSVMGVVVGLVVVGGAAAGGLYAYQEYVVPRQPAAAAPAPGAPAVAAAPAAVPAPAAPAPAATAPAATAPAAAAPAAAAPATPPAVAAAPPTGEAAPKEPPQAAPEAPPVRAERTRSGSRTASRSEPSRREPVRKEAPRVAQASPEPTPARKKGGDLLDFESNDAALDAALGGGGGSSGRSVYVPPARAGGLPDKVSAGDINAAVAQRIDSLRRCVSEQKAREPDASGTLKMRWVIQGDGNVRDVKCLTPEYAQGAFAQCISGVVKTIKFPRSTTTGQEVTFPFNF